MSLKDKLAVIAQAGDAGDLSTLSDEDIEELLHQAGRILTADREAHDRVIHCRSMLPKMSRPLYHSFSLDFPTETKHWCAVVLENLTTAPEPQVKS